MYIIYHDGHVQIYLYKGDPHRTIEKGIINSELQDYVWLLHIVIPLCWRRNKNTDKLYYYIRYGYKGPKGLTVDLRYVSVSVSVKKGVTAKSFFL